LFLLKRLRGLGSDFIAEKQRPIDLRPIDLFHAVSNAESTYWGFTAGTAGAGLARYAITGNAATLHQARALASFGGRAHFNAVRAVLGTPLTRGGTATLGGTAMTITAAAMLGYTAGAVIGTAISQFAFGGDGARIALELYMDPEEFVDKAIFGIGDNVSTILGHYL